MNSTNLAVRTVTLGLTSIAQIQAGGTVEHFQIANIVVGARSNAGRAHTRDLDPSVQTEQDMELLMHLE